MAGIEIKSGATVRADDLRGLRMLEQRLGNDFAAGVVLRTSPTVVHFAKRLWATAFRNCGPAANGVR